MKALRTGLTTSLTAFTVLLVSCASGDPEDVTSQQGTELRGKHHGAKRGAHGVKPLETLKRYRQTVLWEGEVNADDAPIANAPPECAQRACDHLRLPVKLPKHTFRHRDGGLQVALRWFGNPGPHELPPDVPGCCGEFDTLHLFVYKDGVLRGQSAGIIAVSQSLLIPEPENGTYDIWVAYDPDYNVGPSVQYEGLAEVELAPRVHPSRALLPDLSFRGTERISFMTPSFPIFEPDPPPGATCFQSEIEEDGAQTCLRFDQIIANDGKGPLELTFSVPTAAPPDEEVEYEVTQRILQSTGDYTESPAGVMELHGVHGHYHYSSFATAELWASDELGTRQGAAPIRDAQKVSFCIADIRIDTWGQKGDGPRTYYAPDCLFPFDSDGVNDTFVQGLSAGWADVYDWYVPDQYIEVTGISDGYYLLEFCADPENSIQESDETNNCLINHVLLSDMGTQQPHVQVLGVVE